MLIGHRGTYLFLLFLATFLFLLLLLATGGGLQITRG